jgi:hypothetical protein
MTCAAYAVLAGLFGMAMGSVIGFIVGIMWIRQQPGFKP